MILGNHDYNSILHDTPDMLECFHLENVSYLKETGIYYIGDQDQIALSVVSVKDTLLMGASSGMKESLPRFPYDPKIPIKIALFMDLLINVCWKISSYLLQMVILWTGSKILIWFF